MRYFLIPLFLASTLATSQPAASDCQAVDKTNGDLRSLQIVVEAYHKDYNRYPDAVSIEQLAPLASPVYIRDMPLKDAWGTPFLYRTFADGKAYVIASAGSDGKFDETTWSRAPRSTSEDAIVRSGQNPRLWEGCK